MGKISGPNNVIYLGGTYRVIGWNPNKIAVNLSKRPSGTNDCDIRNEHDGLRMTHLVSREKRLDSWCPFLVRPVWTMIHLTTLLQSKKHFFLRIFTRNTFSYKLVKTRWFHPSQYYFFRAKMKVSAILCVLLTAFCI